MKHIELSVCLNLFLDFQGKAFYSKFKFRNSFLSSTTGKINLKQRKKLDAADAALNKTAEKQLPREGVYTCPEQYIKSWGLEKHLAMGVHQY